MGLTYLIRFLVLILGARTPPPMMDEPVTNIPLQVNHSKSHLHGAKDKNDAPTRTQNTQAYTKADTRTSPDKRTRLFKKPANVECFARTCMPQSWLTSVPPSPKEDIRLE
jgi:hypothetical protein